MRNKEQILSDIEATEEQQQAFSERLDSLYNELEIVDNSSEIEEFAKELKNIQECFIRAGFSEIEAFRLMMYWLKEAE